VTYEFINITPKPFPLGDLLGNVDGICDSIWSETTIAYAAPKMLQALQRITHPMADDSDVEFALAVIAEATGESK